MENIQRVVLVHYHEIGLKGRNRSKFEKRLLKNLEALLSGYPIVAIHRISGRLIVFLKEGTCRETALECADFISMVPGVARTSCGFKCERDIEVMYEVAKCALEDVGDFESFKVKARRAHTDFTIDSMQMNRDIGAFLCENFPSKTVKMKDPDVTLGVEVIQNSVFIYGYSVRGIGGLPVGSSGKMICLLSSGIDSPVASWKMARRGANCIGVHFSGRPQTADTSEYLVDDIVHVLNRYGCMHKYYVVALGDYQREISLNAPPALRVILYRRLMFRVAEAIAAKEHALSLVTGESLGQVASQTVENIKCTDASVGTLIFRPLIGTDKLEIIDEAKKLGTFSISTQDAPDCCTLFMPRNPETHAKLEDVLEAEKGLDIDTWVEELVQSAELHDVS